MKGNIILLKGGKENTTQDISWDFLHQNEKKLTENPEFFSEYFTLIQNNILQHKYIALDQLKTDSLKELAMTIFITNSHESEFYRVLEKQIRKYELADMLTYLIERLKERICLTPDFVRMYIQLVFSHNDSISTLMQYLRLYVENNMAKEAMHLLNSNKALKKQVLKQPEMVLRLQEMTNQKVEKKRLNMEDFEKTQNLKIYSLLFSSTKTLALC